MRRLLFACASVSLLGLAACEDLLNPAGDPVDLSYAQCAGATDTPTWFAVQDGDGAWQRVNPTASGSFDFSVASGKAGVAMVTGNGLFVIYATTAELKANLPACNASVRTVSGTVTGYASADNVSIVMGTSSDVVFGSEAPPAAFALATVDATSTDLVAVRYRSSAGSSSSFEAFPNNVFLRRGVSGSTTAVADFASTTEAGAPVSRTLTVTNLAAGEELSVLSYLGMKSTTANMAVYEATAALASGQATAPFYGVPGSRLSAGETQMISIGAARTASSSTHESRFMTSTFSDPTDRSVTLGPILGLVTVTGTSRPSASYNVQSGYDNLYDVVFTQGSGSSRRQAEVLATNAYLGGATSVTLAVPNLSGVSGFSATWLLVPGVSSSWAFLATSADISILNSKPSTYTGADRASVFTP